jgi:2-succinyl-5-enolpyruvyl-6-hydroxy-3-cyclohexene-1-carboxylate synthase
MKVAIAFIDGSTYCEDIGQVMIHRHITDWQEVSEEDSRYLKQGIYMHNSQYNATQMYMITIPAEQGQVVFDTIEQGKEYFRKLEEAARKHREELEAKREEDKRKREKKRREEGKVKKATSLLDKKKLLELLKKEIEEEEKRKKDEKV